MAFDVQDELSRAIGLYTNGNLSLGQAAAIAQVSASEFLHTLGRHGICVNYDVAEFEEDLQTLEKLSRLK